MKSEKLHNIQGPGDTPGFLAEERVAATRKAVGYLARREHSCQEIRRKLENSGFSQDIAAEVSSDLEQRGLVSDRRFAEAYVRYRRQRGFGPVRIRMEMEQKGVASTLSLEAVNECSQDWFVQAVVIRIKKFGIDLPVDYKERARQARFLQQRGFSSDQIQHALRSD